MIQSICVDHFRGIENVVLNDLHRISIITGKNNTGKSTLLEAVFFLLDHMAVDSFLNLNAFRGVAVAGAQNIWEPLFYRMDSHTPIRIGIKTEEKEYVLECQRDDSYLPNTNMLLPENKMAKFRETTKEMFSLKFNYASMDYKEEGHFFLDKEGGVLREIKTNREGNELESGMIARYLHSSIARMTDYLVDEIGRLELADQKNVVIDVLRLLDPEIEDIRTIAQQGNIQLYIRVKDKWIPLQYAGDGTIKILNICLAIMEHRDSVVLIDEIESGLHYSVYHNLWKYIGQLCEENNCQLLATTHSKEIIEALFASEKEICQQSCIYTMYDHMGKKYVRRMSIEEAENASQRLGMELR
ncbi:MAG: ATP-binding protein [Clostridia bacterium]|nr:ATP-binding protein [Clostridia bacterium]